jgi:hypothetical protein
VVESGDAQRACNGQSEVSVSLSAAFPVEISSERRGLMPLAFGVGVFALMLCIGNALLVDSDIFWQIEVGRWIIDHRAVPTADVYSFTRLGAPWRSTSWLAQVLYAAAFAQNGWAGVVILSALAIAAAFALFAQFLLRHVSVALVTIMTMLALLLSMPHLLARPHALALPLMVIWFGLLVQAADRRAAPSFWLLPVLALWANLHGGFVFGLLLIAPLALDAVWNVAPGQRLPLGLRWSGFAFGALLACGCTPYGFDALLASGRVLGLGEVLTILSEWQPADFSKFGAFEACLLALIGVALGRGLTLSPPRILLVLGLTHMALSHVRSVEAFAMLLPLALAQPWARQFGRDRSATARELRPPLAAVVASVLLITAASWSATTYLRYAPVRTQVPVEAVAVLQQRHAERVFNGYEFGGYLIAAGVAPFIDGRAELYGEEFVVAHHRAVTRDVDVLARLLSDYDIDATLLAPATPAAKLLDHLDGWQRVFADDIAVVHARVATR